MTYPALKVSFIACSCLCFLYCLCSLLLLPFLLFHFLLLLSHSHFLYEGEVMITAWNLMLECMTYFFIIYFHVCSPVHISRVLSPLVLSDIYCFYPLW